MATALGGLLARNPVRFSFLRDKGGHQLRLGWPGVHLLPKEEEEEGQVKEKGATRLRRILKRMSIIWVLSQCMEVMTMTDLAMSIPKKRKMRRMMTRIMGKAMDMAKLRPLFMSRTPHIRLLLTFLPQRRGPRK